MDENLGMVMVFTLVSAAQEWLNVQWDKIKLKREETAAQKLREEEEEERVRDLSESKSIIIILYYIYLVL